MSHGTLSIAKSFLNKELNIVIDRPLGSKHPKYGFIYEVNYGYVPEVIVADGEELDAYYLGVEEPLTVAHGIAIAIIHRLDDDDDKLIIVPHGIEMSDEEIEQKVMFQEQWFRHEIIR